MRSMALWLMSDLHLADASTVAMFDEVDQGKHMAALCARIAGEGEGELVLLGDVFDLTAMQPPPRGVAKLGKKMGIDLHDAPERDPVAMCAATRPDVLVLGHTHVPDWVAGDVDEGAEVLRIDAPARGLLATLEELDSGRVIASFDGSVAAPRGQP